MIRQNYLVLLLLPGLLAAQPASNSGTPGAAPRMSPDYCGVTLPPNIAPPNFTLREAGSRFKVAIHSVQGHPIEIRSSKPGITIPFKPWKELLAANLGQPLYFDISAQTAGGNWTDFATVTNRIAREPIDSHLVYRLMKPVYNYFHNLGIYQRNLETYEQKEVLANDRINQGCLNCHTFLNNSPDNMAFHTRGKSGKPMILVRTNEAIQVSRTAGYLAWHPSGSMLAYSVNHVTQFFHSGGAEVREVFDSTSDLGVLKLDTVTDEMPAQLSTPDWLETWPTWSPDGKFLYFCRAPKTPEDRYAEIRYDLMRVSYDGATWGRPELVLSASDTGLSCAQPRISPDGKYLVFCMFAHGHFPAFQKSSDLYLLDLATQKLRRLDEINSDQSESWHCWSHDSRWMVFASRRRDGLLALPYFTHISETGEFSKPFLLPQETPDAYDFAIVNYNLPELIIKPVTIKPEVLAKAVLAPTKVLNVKAATPSGQADRKESAKEPDTYRRE